MRYILLISFALFALVFTIPIFPPNPTDGVRTGPNCHMCEVILNDCRIEYHNNFTGVTVDQLRLSLYQQCDLNLNGFVNGQCHAIADKDSTDILQQLQDGTSSYGICQREILC